uniref:Drebrin n=1 Tax=Amphilophus citrinellus TaxID=61819 RepID=A0A3Q0SM29_AMPCI
MSKGTVNLDTYSLSLLTAKEDILNPRSSTNWALFAYDGVTNKLKLADSGVGGVAELAEKFHISKPQYGLCKVGSVETGAPRIVLINWVGQNVDDYRRTECASHIPAIKNFFKEANAFISAEKVEDVTEEKIRAEFNKAPAHTPTQWVRRSSRSAEKEELVGTNYRKTNAAMEMRLINRDSFWARAEREEEQRKEEERRRAAEERRRLERERILKERRDEEERDRKMNEKLQLIEEQRKQIEQEEELRRKEKVKWEAAALVSQRSMNPREFFRQLSSSSSQSPTSKPFRRYQRSLTDTAFIFSKAEESAASSPRSSPLVSPFSRAPPSPIYRAVSPPTSPNFCLAAAPQRPRAPTSPPISPLRHAPPVSPLPSIPQTNSQAQATAEPKPTSPTQPSAPPASPSLLVSLPPSLEDEEEDMEEQEEDNPETKPEPCAVTTEPALIELEEEEEEEQEEQEEHEKEDMEEEVMEELNWETEPASVEEPVEIEWDEEETKENGEKNNQSEDSRPTAEPAEFSEKEEDSAVAGSPNLRVLAERQICVRALYDYQAEDESEISFEPGDIITDVETVDKAWWRGWSKDGHQGLFPANYVETI